MTFVIYEDIGPSPEFAHTVRDIPPGEDVDLRINSCGGDVFGGMGIVAAINTLREHGHKTRAVVEGLAASMASVVACACDELRMHEGSMMMIHNPWTLIKGDAEELKKQAEVMDKMKSSMISVYQKHFDLSSEEISSLMDEETWISTEDIAKYKLDATVIEGTARIAASVTKEQYYAHIKNRLEMKDDKDMDEQKPVEEKPTEEQPVEEQPTEQNPAEEKPAEDEETVEQLRERIAELVKENEELRRQIDAPVEDRVRGMQSKMQGRINAAQKEFDKQLQVRKEELTKAQAEVTSLRADLEKVKGELQATASALATKTNALAQLNAGVLTPHATTPAPRTRDEARRALANLPMSARAGYYQKHRALIDG